MSYVIGDGGKGFCKWVCSCCRFLKTLGLKNVIGLHNIIIESSSWDSFRVECSSFFQLQLFHLKISSEKHDDINIIWDIDDYLPLMENSLEISAPNLKYLEWDGGMMNHQHLAKLKFNVASLFDKGNWESQNLDLISQLKGVTLELSYGSNESELQCFCLNMLRI
ncbi:hypothetical protein FF1_013925 [Malus domestica]